MDLVRKLPLKQLIVFDFDETIVDCNSDTWVHCLAPDGVLPPHLQWKPGKDYFVHIQELLEYLHLQRVTEKDFYDCLKQMPPAPGILEGLIKVLGCYPDKYEMIILSDANSYFIEAFLKAKGIDDIISTVLTNKGRFDQNGMLKTTEFHHQSFCPISPRNLCKGKALKDFLTQRLVNNNLVYTRIHYVGDGENDLCPSTKLSSNDTVFPRRGYPLHQLCEKLKANSNHDSHKIDASVVPWADGREICDHILNSLKGF